MAYVFHGYWFTAYKGPNSSVPWGSRGTVNLTFWPHRGNSLYCSPPFRAFLRGSQLLHVEGKDCCRTDAFFFFHHHSPCHTQSMRTSHPRLRHVVSSLHKKWVTLSCNNQYNQGMFTKYGWSIKRNHLLSPDLQLSTVLNPPSQWHSFLLVQT